MRFQNARRHIDVSFVELLVVAHIDHGQVDNPLCLRRLLVESAPQLGHVRVPLHSMLLTFTIIGEDSVSVSLGLATPTA